MAEVLGLRSSDGQYSVGGDGRLGEILGGDELRTVPAEIFLGDPTGLPAEPSDVNRHSMFTDL